VKLFLVVLSCHIFGFRLQSRNLDSMRLINLRTAFRWMILLLLIWLHEKVSDIDIFIVAQQLVQFLLKQAGVDKRTGDLYGNRDLMNIARNMARGLKVCIKLNMLFIFIILVKFDLICIKKIKIVFCLYI